MITRRAIPGQRSSRGATVRRLVLSPASWGIAEAPDWGHQLSADRVLSEAAAVGEGAITAGPPGFLPDRSDQARRVLSRHRLKVAAGHVQAVLHHQDIRGLELAHIDGHAHWLSALGAGTLVLSAIRARTSGEHRQPLSKPEWAHLLHSIGSVEHLCARHKLRLAVQPRFGATIQGPEDIERILVGCEAGLSLDVAQLVLVGADPLEVVENASRRIQHVNLNDVDMALARDVRNGNVDYADAVTANLYTPLGEGGADVVEIIGALRATGYQGSYTLDQPIRLGSAEERPLGRISRSLEFLMPLLG